MSVLSIAKKNYLLFEGQKDRVQSTSRNFGELDMKNKQAEEILKNLQSASAYILLLHVWTLML